VKINLNNVKKWIKQHQIISFFILTFVISWGLWIPLIPLIFGRKLFMLLPLAMIALFGPALAGIIISAIVNPEPRQDRSKTQWLAFLLTWMVATPVFVFDPALRRQGISISVGLVVIAALIALIPAYIISSAFSRVPGIRKYLESLVKPKGSAIWYLIAIVLIPAMLLLGILIMSLLGKEIPSPRVSAVGTMELIKLIILSAAYRFFYANAVGEEPGWRGFALPRLQARYNPLVANIILALFWALWHLPLPQAQGLSSNPRVLLYYCWSTFLHSLIIAWLFNRTRGSILVAGLLHLSSNVSRLFMPETIAFDFIRPAFCVFIIIFDRMWLKLPEDSAAVYQTDKQLS